MVPILHKNAADSHYDDAIEISFFNVIGDVLATDIDTAAAAENFGRHRFGFPLYSATALQCRHSYLPKLALLW